MLKTEYWPIISKSATPAVTKDLTKKIAGFVDKNSDILLTLDMSRRYSFADDDRAVIYNACGFTEPQIEVSIRQSKVIYDGNKIQSNPFYISCLLLMGHFMNRKDRDSVIMVGTYMSLQMYTSQHKGFFKFNANKQIMDYTLEHLDNTFLIRDFPSIFAFIQDNTRTAVETYKDRIARCDDADITWVIDSIWTRLKGKLTKIANQFYKNHKSGNYLNNDSDSYDPDNFREIDNVSFGVDRLVNKVYIKLINRQYDKRFIKYSISKADVSTDKITKLIEDIIDQDGETKELYRLIEAIIQFYLIQSGKPIQYVAKGDFIAFMKTAYGSNTDVAQMATIKETIDKWLADNMYKYGKARYGKTIQSTYRRAIYMFFVFVINYEAKV